ncbi:extracellular solute-binding protein [Halobacillus kuroshimensis]|uniref:extracellular solute-binding protein n=1 Tax=Halobacillus kuroshimensis TaxID=302481 RepID=UPI0003FA896E|nr:extracellular solute-binding protein [Halobacillus kuroshimensis]
MKLKNMMLTTGLALTTLLAECGGTEESAAEGESAKEPLVVYTNSASDGRGDWLKEQASEQGFDIEIVEGGGGDIANRLVAEKNNPVADVVYGLSTMDYENFKKQDMLAEYVPSWAGEIQGDINDPEGYYHSIVKQAILMIYNTENYDASSAPADWPELWNNEEYHGQYAILGHEGGTGRAIIAGILNRYKDENGEYGISQEGWDELEKYLTNGYHPAEGEDFFAKVADGSVPISGIWSSGIVPKEEEFGVDVAYATPEVGVPHVVEQVAIVEGTEQQDTAEAFVDWFGSSEVQGKWTEEFSTLPANEGALEYADEATKELAESVTVQDIDWGFVSENIDQWVEKVELQLLP